MNECLTRPQIYVRMLGGFSITAGDKTVVNYKNSSKKNMDAPGIPYHLSQT